MQLLHGSPIAAPQFASLSFLVKPSSDVGMGEPMVMAAPTSLVSYNGACAALQELHGHLTTILKAAGGKGVSAELAKEDEKLLDEIQIYRPNATSGLALQYRLIRGDEDVLNGLSAHILAAIKPTSKSPSTPAGLAGIIFCVGVSGLPAAFGSCSVQYTLPVRMQDCALLMTKITDPQSLKNVLSTFLLSDDESRKTNEMAAASATVFFTEADDAEQARGLLSPMVMMSPMGMISPIANVARKTSKRMSMRGDIGGSTSDNAGAVQEGEILSLKPNSADAVKAMTERLNVLSVAEADTFLRKYAVSGQERKANLDLTGGGKSRFRRRKADAKDPDFDNFDYRGPAKLIVKKKSLQPMVEPSHAGSASLRQPRKDTRGKVPALPGKHNDVAGRRMSNHHDDGASTSHHSHKSGGRSRLRKSNHGYDDDVSLFSDARSTAHDSILSSGVRLQVNIALNEDLSCSYKLAQLSSCSVEGVVQIQVKSNSRSSGPFMLVVRDPSGHVDSLQENKKFADDVSGSVSKSRGSDNDHKFAVAIPKGDNYFPVLRYKCVGDLRPVPIRVQTRVKVDGEYCRVALQISSNPNNESSLTDLTIIMGVPDEVRGETLVTQPAGGVWNESKRSVIWCVSELGSGEKFQLQGHFEMDRRYSSNDEKPKFPVLVRCQCLFAQLSDVELEVRELPDVFPADVAMKLARRFRLSHRERS